jgi:hypothetical protein
MRFSSNYIERIQPPSLLLPRLLPSLPTTTQNSLAKNLRLRQKELNPGS